MDRPLMIYDGDCGFCRHWIERWRAITGDRVRYGTSQERGRDFPQIPAETFEKTVVLVEASGNYFTGAEAVFRGLAQVPGKGGGLFFYQNFPGGRALSEWAYRQVAERRGFFSGLTRLFLGKGTQPASYYFSRRLFLIFLGLIYLAAFVSLAVQVRGLVGSEGILPAQEFLNRVQEHLGNQAYWRIPTVFWLQASDPVLLGVAWLGAALSVLLLIGLAPAWTCGLLWLLYLSLFSVGQTFLGFQWDILLLETGFLAIFLSPLAWRPSRAAETRPSWAVLWLLRWLLFRLMFLSGLVKLKSGDVAWKKLTALEYHYETQPLPTWIGYYLHQLPPWIQRESTFLMFGLELVVPFLIFFPGRIRVFGAGLLVLLQVLIFLSGNYGFFNFLTLALCVLLIPDRVWPKGLQKLLSPWRGTPAERGVYAWPKAVTVPLFGLVLLLSLGKMERYLGEIPLVSAPLHQLENWTAPFHLANNYGLFAVMTKQRPEIQIEGSRDGQHWQRYPFRYKPDELTKRPAFVAPHMPRLDWQMWFAALSPPGRYPPWIHFLLVRLLEGSEPVLQLFSDNPFPGSPPHYVRARVAPYYFSDLKMKQATGQWWVRGEWAPYTPVYEMDRGTLRIHR